ncbi:MAG TPA: hypothetical protein VJQ08_01210 [Candidatus Dormibacteraeota bacterium]|nr:hypothetical protein [Candidatus Dormibacteraeota bacterium]
MAYLLAGPLVAIVGIGAVFFVLRRKSVEKRSMYSARREQIEHKVKAARQRTLAGHGHVEKTAAPAAGTSPFEQAPGQATATYEAPVFAAPPAAPPTAPPRRTPEAPAPMPWEQPSIPPPAQQPAPATFGYPTAAPAPVEPFTPAPEPSPAFPTTEPAWTPEPAPAEPPRPAEPVAPARSTAAATSAGAWSVVSTSKESAEPAPQAKKKGKKKEADAGDSPWQLASGEAPGAEADEPMIKQSSGTLMAVAQYAVLVVGLVMVLIGVLVMVANSHVT